MKKYLVVITLLLFGNILFNIYLNIAQDKQGAANYLFNTTYGLIFLLGGIVATFGLKKNPPTTPFGRGLVFYASSLYSYSLALFIWTVYNLILKVEIPYPGIGDIFFVLFQLFSILGFIFIVKGFGGVFTVGRIIEFVTLSLIIFVLLFSFLDPTSLVYNLPLMTKILNIFYPMSDAIMVALVITGLRTEKGSLHPNLLIFAFAAIIMAFADTAFSFRSAQGVYWNGDISDTLYMLSGAIYSFGLILLTSRPVVSSEG